MDDEAMNPTVTLNANVDPYVQGMNQAAEVTQATTESIGKLNAAAEKISSAWKKTAQGLQVIGGGSLAGLTALALAADNANKQLSTLSSTAAITGKDVKFVQNSISGIASGSSKSRGEIADLTTQISKLGITSQKQMVDLTGLFGKMGSATGEPSGGLAEQLTQLNRTMGSLDTQSFKKYADSTTYLSAKLGVSATGVLSFANAIAPFTRAAGIGETATLGLGAAFSKAGADGAVAANTFSQITSEISNSIQDGSPNLRKYADIVGKTLDEFKNTDAAERLAEVIDAINTAGPKAGRILTNLGFDGVRAARSLQQVASESGGIRQALGIAGEGEGSVEKGSKAAESNLSDQFAKVRNNTQNLSISLGQQLLGPMTVAAKAFSGITSVAAKATELFSPLVKVIGLLAGAFLLLGTAMRAASIASAVNSVGFIARGAAISGTLAGVRAGRAGGLDTAAGQSAAGVAGQKYAANELGRGSAMFMNAGNRVGQFMSNSNIGAGASRTVAQVLRGASFIPRIMGSYYDDASKPFYERSPFTGKMQPSEKGAPGATSAPSMMSTAIRNPLQTLKGIKEGLVDPRSVEGWQTGNSPKQIFARAQIGIQDAAEKYNKSIARYQTAFDKGRISEERFSHLREQAGKRLATEQLAAAGPAGVKLSEEIGKTGSIAKENGRLMGESFKSMGKNIRSAGINIAAAGGRLLGSVGMMVASPMGAILAATAAYSTIRNIQQKMGEGAKAESKANNLSVYQQAAGQSGTGGVKLKDLLKAESQSKAKLDQDWSTVSESDTAFAQKNPGMTDKRLLGASRTSALAFLRTNVGKTEGNEQVLSQISADLVRQFGATAAQGIVDSFKNKSDATFEDYQNLAQLQKREFDRSGYFNRNSGFGSAQGLQALISGNLNSIEQRAGNVGSVYGTETGSAYRAQQMNAATGMLAGGGTNASGVRAIGEAALATTGVGSAFLGKDANQSNTIYNHAQATWLKGFGLQGKYAQSNQEYQSYFRKLEDDYGDGARLGYSYSGLMNYAQGKELDLNKQEDKQKAIQGYIADRGGERGKDIVNQVWGEYAGMSSADLSAKVQDGLSKTPTAKDNAVFKNQVGLVGKQYGSTGTAVSTSVLQNTKAISALTDQVGNAAVQFSAAGNVAADAVKKSGGDFDKAAGILQAMAATTGNPAAQQLYGQAVKQIQQDKNIQGPVLTMEDRLDAAQKAYNFQKDAEDSGQINNVNPEEIAAGKALQESSSGEFKQFLVSVIQTLRSYNKQVTRSNEDFSLQQERARLAFNKNIKRQVEDMAGSIADPYSRIPARSTQSTSAIGQNIEEQNQVFDTQNKNLKKAEQLGLDKKTIQFLDLANPEKAQELARIVDEAGTDSKSVERLNNAVKERLRIVEESLKSGYNKVYDRAVEDFNLAMQNGADDFNKAMERLATDVKDTFASISGNYDELIAEIKRLGGETIGVMDRINEARRRNTFLNGGESTSGDGGGTTPTSTTNTAQTGGRGTGTVVRTRTPESTERDLNNGAPGSPTEDVGDRLGVPNGTTQYVDWSRWGTAGSGLYGSIAYAGGSFGRGAHFYNHRKASPDSNFIDQSVKNTGEWVHLNGDYYEWVPQGYKFDGPKIWTGGQDWNLIAPRAYGGSVDAGKSYVVGEKGPELLQGVSGHIVPSTSFQSSVARETVQMMRVAGFQTPAAYQGSQSTNVDNSTKIMGGQFTVVSGDPDEMGRKLKGKDRLDRLRGVVKNG